MRFLSNFGCKIIFTCSMNFWHQQDSNSLFKGSIVMWPICASGLFVPKCLFFTSRPLGCCSFQNILTNTIISQINTLLITYYSSTFTINQFHNHDAEVHALQRLVSLYSFCSPIKTRKVFAKNIFLVIIIKVNYNYHKNYPRIL